MQQLCGFMQQSGNNIFVVCANNFSVFQDCSPILRLSFSSFSSFSHKPKISAKLFHFSVSQISNHQTKIHFKYIFIREFDDLLQLDEPKRRTITAC